jgi:hypothetical protein
MTSTPAWISTLGTASIAADMAAAAADGAVTASEMATLFDDLDASLSGSRLTATEVSDLRTIAANLGNGLTTSACLTYAIDALVNGDSANASWTGGARSSTALGDLAVGAGATALAELIGKWLLGTDLPSSTVSLSGEPSYQISYSTVTSPLFGATGPSVGDVNQGALGDCYFLAPCAELAAQNPSAVESMFTALGGGVYGVRFYLDGQARYVIVNSELANGGAAFNRGADLWASLAEKAWAQFQTGALDTGNFSANYGNSYSSIGNGGDPAYALEALTGASVIADYNASGAGWTQVDFNDALDVMSVTRNVATSSLLTAIAAALAAGDDVIVSSNTDAVDASGRATLMSDHAFAVYGYDNATQQLLLRNPWGVEPGQYWDVTFEIGLQTLLAAGDTLTLDNAGAAAGWSGAISGTAAYISANFDAINASPAVTSITLTESGLPVLNLSPAQAANGAATLAKIANALFQLDDGGLTLYVQAPAYALSQGASNFSVWLNGTGDTLSLSGASQWATLAGASQAVWAHGGGEWITLKGAVEWAELDGANQAAWAYGASEWITLNGSGEWAELDGTGEAVWANGGAEYVTLNGASQWATLNGTGEAIWANGGGEYITLNGAAQWATLNGTGEAIWAENSGEYITLNGASEWSELDGAQEAIWTFNSADYVTLTGSSQWATLNGGNEAVYAFGDGEYITLNGATQWAQLYGSNESVWAFAASEWITLAGSSDWATLYGSNESVTVSGAGDGVAIAGANDLAVFSTLSGQDVVIGFNATTTIQLNASEFANWSALLAHTSQSGADAVIALDASDTLTLKTVAASALSASNFRFG